MTSTIPTASAKKGFTLIELSIVLVIIGLIIGSVLVGQDLIAAAATRAQISQIQKYDAAVNTFRTKYGYIPGDIPNPYAPEFGFAARGSAPGEGDGNGLLEGNVGLEDGGCEIAGETVVFWVDLSVARMIDGNFNTAPIAGGSGTDITSLTTPGLANYLPAAKIGNGNYVYAYSGGYWNGSQIVPTGINYFGLSAVTTIEGNYQGSILSNPGLTVAQAYNIDKKIDDGLPQSGSVIAEYLANNDSWTDGTLAWLNPPNTSAVAGSATTCYDNGGVAGPNKYSMEISRGSNPVCALSFKMQGAAR